MCQPGRPGPQGESQEVSSPGFVAFQRAKSCGASFTVLGSSSTIWSGFWPREAARIPGRARREVDVAVDGVGEVPSINSSMNATICGIDSVALGTWSGMPRPRSPVSSRYHSVARSASSALSPGAAS